MLNSHDSFTCRNSSAMTHSCHDSFVYVARLTQAAEALQLPGGDEEAAEIAACTSLTVCCSMLHCFAVRNSVLQCDAEITVCTSLTVCCSMRQRVAACCSVLQRVAEIAVCASLTV